MLAALLAISGYSGFFGLEEVSFTSDGQNSARLDLAW
jgi:hypothetical protein